MSMKFTVHAACKNNHRLQTGAKNNIQGEQIQETKHYTAQNS
jgi:hypothetical protein